MSAARPAGTASGNLAAILESHAEAAGWMARPAFRDPARSWSHGEVHDGGRRVANYLSRGGVRPGDRVVLAAADRVELIWALLGVARVGATAVLVNPLLPAADHRFMLDDAAPALVMSDRALTATFRPARTVAMDDLRALEPSTVPAAEVAPDTPAYAQYTSGTTGMPRAALHRHSDPACFYRAMGPVLMLQPDDVILSVSKAYFAYGLGNTVFFPLFSGCSAILDPLKPTVDHVGSLAAGHGATVLFAVPSFYAGMVARGDARCFRSVRIAVSAGETLQPALYSRARSWLDDRDVLDGLGSTEVGQTFISNLPGRCRPSSIGIVLPGYEASVRDDSGQPVPAGQAGALWVRGQSVMLGYLNRAEETAAALVDGWCRTGDRVSVDDAGYYHHHGRLDDMEIVGGNNVAPIEVEAVLLEHPAVVEVAVVALPDDTGAFRLRGFAVLSSGYDWSPGLEGEILALARDRLAPFKVPRSLSAVDSLPRTMTGKLRRHVLRAGWPNPR